MGWVQDRRTLFQFEFLCVFCWRHCKTEESDTHQVNHPYSLGRPLFFCPSFSFLHPPPPPLVFTVFFSWPESGSHVSCVVFFSFFFFFPAVFFSGTVALLLLFFLAGVAFIFIHFYPTSHAQFWECAVTPLYVVALTNDCEMETV